MCVYWIYNWKFVKVIDYFCLWFCFEVIIVYMICVFVLVIIVVMGEGFLFLVLFLVEEIVFGDID